MTTSPYQSPNRSAGILLHPTSLPGPYGIGDIGPGAYAWVDALVRARQKWWQVLPLTPTGFADSPYQSFSAFAGNPYLISPEALVQDGLLHTEDLGGTNFPMDRVDFGPVINFKVPMLAQAWTNFQAGGAVFLKGPYEEFLGSEAAWLDDYGLFMALKESHGGKSWQEWPADVRLRKAAALNKARRNLADAASKHRFEQFLFYRQWHSLKKYANERGVRLIGDVPIFISSDSADVWANPDWFLLDAERRPKVVAGVPPDYFSRTGQLWGNPLYDWAKLKQTGYAWWAARFKAVLQQVDLVRLDHFRGFEAYWEVPAGKPTAEIGQWVKGPGADFLDVMKKELGSLPLIAEDLGVITPEVETLRDRFGLPGMRILQFAFVSPPEIRFLPHNFDRNTVVYTGTHDNETTLGWYNSLSDYEKHQARRYLARDGSDICWDLIRLAWMSVADWAVAPLQDFMCLGPAARMNYPGKPAGNWAWRFTPDMLTDAILDRLADLTEVAGR